VKGTLKAAVRKIKVGSVVMLVMAASVYDTKPVNVMSTIHVAASLDEQQRKVWSRARGTKIDVPFTRLNIIHDYNQYMNQVDRQDHLQRILRASAPSARSSASSSASLSFESPFTDPVWRGSEKTDAKHRTNCQWCKFMWIERGRVRPPDCKAKTYEGPQNKEVMYCTKCGVHLCSASCWNEFHGICGAQ